MEEYGEDKAQVFLAAVQVMITGNMYGIPFSAFVSRTKGHPYKDSTLLYELVMLIVGIISIPFAIVHSLLRALFGLPNERFDRSPSVE